MRAQSQPGATSRASARPADRGRSRSPPAPGWLHRPVRAWPPRWRSSAAPRSDRPTVPLAGLILTGLAFVAALVVPWEKSSRALMGVLPVVDIAALGLARQNDTGTSTALVLIVVPALWLGWLFGRRGAAITVAAVLLLAITPTVINIGLTGEVLTRSLLVTVVTGFSALVIAVSREKAHSRCCEPPSAVPSWRRRSRRSSASADWEPRSSTPFDVGLVLLEGRRPLPLTINRRHHDFMRLAFPTGHQRPRPGSSATVFHEDGDRRITHPARGHPDPTAPPRARSSTTS